MLAFSSPWWQPKGEKRESGSSSGSPWRLSQENLGVSKLIFFSLKLWVERPDREKLE